MSKAGAVYVESLNTSYSQQYLDAVRSVDETYCNLPDVDLLKIINSKALKALKRIKR